MIEHFGLSRPLATHWRRAVCSEVNCPHFILGWETLIDERTEFGKVQAGYIRHKSGREFREEALANGLTSFKFHAGQKCFREHKLPLEREPLFTRGLSRRLTEHKQWIDEFNENSYQINKILQEG